MDQTRRLRSTTPYTSKAQQKYNPRSPRSFRNYVDLFLECYYYESIFCSYGLMHKGEISWLSWFMAMIHGGRDTMHEVQADACLGVKIFSATLKKYFKKNIFSIFLHFTYIHALE